MTTNTIATTSTISNTILYTRIEALKVQIDFLLHRRDYLEKVYPDLYDRLPAYHYYLTEADQCCCKILYYTKLYEDNNRKRTRKKKERRD